MQQDKIHKPSDQIMLAAASARPLQERRLKLPQYGDQVMKCPRCDSLNTKFCYYNNYSLTQPRHFCKNCKRYWTKGGALRNVPVGGGCRKNKRIKQRATDHDQVAAASSVTDHADEAIISSIRGDGFSSSSPLQHNFSDRHGLTFERLDQATRAFSVSSPPISVKWAADQEPSGSIPLENLHIPFDSNILALTLTGNLKKDVASKRLQNALELSSMFEPQLSLLAPASSSSLSDTTLAPYNFCLEGFGVPVSNGDLQWRLPPRLVTMAEEGQVTNGRPFMQMMEQDLMGISPESLRHSGKGKLSLDCMHLPISTEIDVEHANQSCCDWHMHPPTDHAIFEATGDTLGYWTSGSWAPDMTMYGLTGSQLL